MIRSAVTITIVLTSLTGLLFSKAFAESPEISSLHEPAKPRLDPHIRVACKQPSDCFNHGLVTCDGQQNRAVFLELCEGVCVLHLLQICPDGSSCRNGMCVGPDLNVVNRIRNRSVRACESNQGCATDQKCLEIPGGGSECFAPTNLTTKAIVGHSPATDPSAPVDRNSEENRESSSRGAHHNVVVSTDEICDTGIGASQ